MKWVEVDANVLILSVLLQPFSALLHYIVNGLSFPITQLEFFTNSMELEYS